MRLPSPPLVFGRLHLERCRRVSDVDLFFQHQRVVHGALYPGRGFDIVADFVVYFEQTLAAVAR